MVLRKGPHANMLAANEEPIEAYRILRAYGHGEKAELVLRESKKADAIRQLLTEEVAAAEGTLRAAG